MKPNYTTEPVKLAGFDVEIDGEPNGKRFLFYCPGCKENHSFDVDCKDRPRWTFNGDMQAPTFEPSLLYANKVPRCHLFIRGGMIDFLSDCGHELAGKMVAMVPIPGSERW